MKAIFWMLAGSLMGTVFIACAMGSKKIDFEDFPRATKENSIWQKCPDTYEYVCKNVCHEYDKKNQCKKPTIEKLSVKEALDSGFAIVHKTFLLSILK